MASPLLCHSGTTGALPLAEGPRRRYSERIPMNIRVLGSAALLSFLAATSAYADARSEAKEQVEFGIAVSQKGLWKEAMYRWQRAVQIDPSYAAAWNNLAIAYEHQGQFDSARDAYERAVGLDPKNVLIRQNYDLFKEINDRSKNRGDR